MSTESDPKPAESVPPAPAPVVSASVLSGLSLDDFILLNEEIAGMAKAGLPLDQGLALFAQELGRGKLQRVTSAIAQDLKSGCTLPQAIERQQGQVPAFYAQLLAAGIRAGRVTDVITTLTTYARSLAEVRSIVLGALLYPVIVLVLSLTLFGFVSAYLMPMFEQIYSDFKMKLPPVTRAVFFVYRHAFTFFVVLPGTFLVGLLVLRTIMFSSSAGRQSWARFWYMTPIMGVLVRSARLAAFTELLGILVDHGVPLPEAFLLAGRASSDPLMAIGSQQVHDGLSQGMPLGVVLREQALVPEMVTWMVGVAEKRGTLGPTLHQVAETYRRQAEMRAHLLRHVLPPLLVLIVAGAVVITFVVALLGPMMGMIHALGGGGK